MGFFDKYPNTDFHELNLDWVIAKINNLKAHIKTYDDQIEGLGEAINEKANTDDLSDVAFSGDYDDLTNKPNIPDVSDYYNKQTVDNMLANKANSSDLATVATTGDYNDLTNKPTIPAAQVNSDWNANSGVAEILNKPTLATVATSGSYNDLTNQPTIPAAQVNSDWDAVSGVEQILNKPTLATVATSGSYDDLTNKPALTYNSGWQIIPLNNNWYIGWFKNDSISVNFANQWGSTGWYFPTSAIGIGFPFTVDNAYGITATLFGSGSLYAYAGQSYNTTTININPICVSSGTKTVGVHINCIFHKA